MVDRFADPTNPANAPEQFPMGSPEWTAALQAPEFDLGAFAGTNPPQDTPHPGNAALAGGPDGKYASPATLYDTAEVPKRDDNIWDQDFRKFFISWADEITLHGNAVPLPGTAPAGVNSAGTPIQQAVFAASGPGVILGFSLINPSTVASVFLTLYRGADQGSQPFYWLTIPAAVDATHPGVLNWNMGTNGLRFPGVLSISATAPYQGVILLARKTAH